MSGPILGPAFFRETALPEARTQASAVQRARSAVSRGVTWRALLIAVVLTPINAYWVVQMEVVRYSAHPTTVSFFFSTVFILLILALGNMGVRRFLPRVALTQGELLVIYAMLSVATCITGHDGLQVLTPQIPWPFRFATPENGWENLFLRHVPTWLSVQDPSVYEGYFIGSVNLYRLHILRGWAPALLAWGGLVFVLLLVMLCMSSILRKQWLEGERLTCPLVHLPLEITAPRVALFHKPAFWIGFGLAASVDIWNSLAFNFPSLPQIPIIERDMSPYFRARPWNAVGWTPISFYPFIIGLGILIPTDFLFSCWFFYIFWKAERVLSAAFGLDQIPDFPFINQQAFGAYMTFTLYAIWLGRGYLRAVLRRIVGLSSELSEAGEAMRYGTAALGILLGFVALVWFSVAAGLSLWLGVVFFLIYFALAVACTRMRAQFGTPVHDLHFTGPDQTLTMVLGSQFFGKRDLTIMSLYYWFNRAYRNHPMPHVFEGFRMAQRADFSPRRYVWAQVLATAVGIVAGFWAMLHLMYGYGARAKSRASFGAEPYNRLAGWLNAPTGANWGATGGIGVGLGLAFVLEIMRTRFVQWPFHPLGFAISSSWEMNLVWMPLLIAWLAKTLILRYGGLNTFRAVVPGFMGLILGQFVVGSIVNIISIVLQIPSYMFWQ